MDSPPKFAETLSFILKFLRSEGFYAAEEALISEIETRCPAPEGGSPNSTADESAGSFGEQHDTVESEFSRSPQGLERAYSAGATRDCEGYVHHVQGPSLGLKRLMIEVWQSGV